MEVIALDIGGTNTRIGLLGIKGNNIFLKEKKAYLTKDVTNLAKLINSFNKKVNNACIAIAGPIIDGKAKLTNGKLAIDLSKLKKDTKLKNIKLVNDFYANAASLPFIKKSDVFMLNKGTKTNKNKMIIGPGTGLGKAYSLNSRVYPSEGGLTIIGIEDIEDYALIDYFKKKVRGIVYYEDILSGRGLSNIYEYLEINSNLLPDSKIRKIIIDKKNKPELITENYKKDKLSGMTIDIFVKFYARYARDSALNILCSEVYLAGGISNSLKEPMKKDFMKEFAMHRHYKTLLKKIGVSIITNSDIGLVGAGAIAAGLQQ